MIIRVQMALRLLMFGAALCILFRVLWGIAAGEQRIATPYWALWLIVAAAFVRLMIWATLKARVR